VTTVSTDQLVDIMTISHEAAVGDVVHCRVGDMLYTKFSTTKFSITNKYTCISDELMHQNFKSPSETRLRVRVDLLNLVLECTQLYAILYIRTCATENLDGFEIDHGSF
jgi:hypothetical protein